MSGTSHRQSPARDARDERFERAAWGLFLIMIGGLWLVPNDVVPGGTWLVGTGAIMLGLNAARYLSGIRTSTFSTFLGVIALALGISDMVGVELPILPLILVLCGAQIIYHNVTSRARG